ncbi:acyltransferase, partial [Frankia sp. AgB32]|uniref:acyltransferase family protein n=1 Tax=Frankia sp. AgB32 TaxID=631119 RepID=UPI00200BA7DF
MRHASDRDPRGNPGALAAEPASANWPDTIAARRPPDDSWPDHAGIRAAPADRGQYGYARSDFTQSDYARSDYAHPEHARSDYPRSDYPRSDYPRSDYPRSDYARPDYARPDHPRPDHARSDYARSDHPRSDHARPGYGRSGRGGYEDVPSEGSWPDDPVPDDRPDTGRSAARPARVAVPDLPEPRSAERGSAAPAGSPSISDAAARFAYSPALDGIRVLCIYIILAGHMGAIHASNVAVDVFFVLSGFLITALLLAEHSRTGTISIGRFLVRRAFRLMPAMWVYLAVGLAVTVAFKWNDIAFRDDYIGSALSAFLNVNNWYKVLHPAAGGRWLAHVWSLSLEEQFYLVWPGLFLLLMRSARLRPHMIKILVGMIAILVGWTYFVASRGTPHSRVYLATDTHVAPLLVGCLVAVWRDRRLRALARPEDRQPAGTDPRGHRRRRAGQSAGGGSVTANVVQRWGAGRRIAALGLVAAIALVFFAFLGPDKDGYAANWLDRAGYLPSSLLAAVVILGADLRRDAAWVRLLGRPRMAFLGKITFSIYLWHYPVISAASGQLVPRIGLWPSVVCAAATSTFIAYFSNRWIEKPAQRARPKWADAPRGPARPATPVGPTPAGPAPVGALRVGRAPDGRTRPAPGVGSVEDTAWLSFGGARGGPGGGGGGGGAGRDRRRIGGRDRRAVPVARRRLRGRA